MKPYAAPLDDIFFILNHVAGAPSLGEYDAELTQEIAGHFAAFAEGEIAPLDEAGDRIGAQLQNGRVVMPEGFKAAYDAYVEQGWQGLTAPEDFGGQGLGALNMAVTSEILSGANHSFQMVVGLVPGAIRTILNFGTEAQKAAYIPPLTDGSTLATMCLTEPGAGSDLARVRCRAVPTDTGYAITGEKIFISGGDQDLSDKVLHLVLARTSDNGIKGLSLFLCRSEKADGTRNAVTVTRIEEKMGLHASPTCQLAFDGAEAELIGQEGKGLMAMFTLMNHARADVALQGVAHASRAYDVASNYAKDRVQGRKDDGSPAKLTDHADVRRMLDEIDAIALGGRAMAHLSFVTMEGESNPALLEFLTPVAKVYCTDGGMTAAELGVQVLGGYGFLQEYRLEQTYRDVRITAIYEGANGIHARMLVTRLLPGPEAEAFAAFLAAEAPEGIATLWDDTRKSVLVQSDATPLAHDFMQLTIECLLLALWTRIVAQAENHPDPERIRRVGTMALKRGAIRAKTAALFVTEVADAA
ncbi:acyl-CoA dehydrogenase family protein [Pseudoprimorskyibacter insulae]|uniref:3-methylmercaptopropionyl-CoA dehydrogenase n=1 Tax=Pseudoprimorskyibacter insulae TaxID=1695997 RepID=A0A2R8AQB6_9RHOB|nr:acyl-CoA dehydrogenase family protein [Pseudoprimorskyibacter insulae]SPF78049.1 3-methylmercaptopropionyl-CoA dehydrogenase [Pseudoprimorskyibacter insulae]